MVRWIFLLIFCFPVVISYAQEENKGFSRISLSIGPNFSNLLASEAPHKIYIPGSDQRPALMTGMEVSQSPGYFNYKTSIIDDMRTGVTVRLATEYRLANQWSIQGAVGYEEKGINLKHFNRESRIVNVYDPNPETPERTNSTVYYDEYFDVKIQNDYLTFPVQLRKYMAGQKFYVQGGFYLGWLLKSEIYTFKRNHTYFANGDQPVSDFQSSVEFQDEDKEFTNTLDPGLSLGCGLNYPLSDRLSLNGDLLLSAGLQKVDKKYNNEYTEDTISMYSGIGLLVRSTNYFGLNSNATNLSASLTIGCSYMLR